MVKVYADLIEKNLRKLSQINEKIREDVKQELINRGRTDLIND